MSQRKAAKSGLFSIFFVLMLWQSPVVLAYKPDTGHASLTRTAFQAYDVCFAADDVFSSEIRKQILAGNQAMDEGDGHLEFEDDELDHGIFGLFERSLNWHFYNPNKTRKNVTMRGNVEQSQRRLWAGAKKGFADADALQDKALFFGAMVHLVEDVSVPAHVVPVYHGPVTSRILGEFATLVNYLGNGRYTDGLMIPDVVDGMSPDRTWIMEQFAEEISAACREVAGVVTTPDQIRDDLARATLAALEEEIDRCPGVKWGVFWDERIPARENKYFNRYNLDAPFFNGHGVIKGENGVANCTLREGDWRYRQFLFQRHLQAVKADLRLLRWARTKMLD